MPDQPSATAPSLAEMISIVWQVKPEGALALTPQERRAVELCVSRRYTNPWLRSKMIKGGWSSCLLMARTARNQHGLSDSERHLPLPPPRPVD